MKYLLLLALTVAAPGVYAQTVTGICTDLSGNPIEYVTIGIQGAATGTISGHQGRFSLHIPDSLKQNSLLFSHLSFETGVYPIERLTAEQNPANLHIGLSRRDFQIATVEVRHSALKTINLNSRGTRMPGLTVNYDFENFGHNIGQVIELPRKSLIRELDFSVNNSFEKLVIRVSLYGVKNSDVPGKAQLVPLIRSPRYVEISNSGKMQRHSVDFRDEAVEAEGPLYVRLELVEKAGSGTLLFPAYSGTEKYFINLHTGRTDKFPIGIGLRLRGSLLK